MKTDTWGQQCHCKKSLIYYTKSLTDFSTEVLKELFDLLRLPCHTLALTGEGIFETNIYLHMAMAILQLEDHQKVAFRVDDVQDRLVLSIFGSRCALGHFQESLRFLGDL